MTWVDNTPELLRETSCSAAHAPYATHGQRWARCHAHLHALEHLQSAWLPTRTISAASTALSDELEALPVLRVSPQHTTESSRTPTAHCIACARSRRRQHALGRPAIAQDHPASVRHVGTLCGPSIDTTHGQPCRAALPRCRPTGLQGTCRISPAQSGSRRTSRRGSRSPFAAT